MLSIDVRSRTVETDAADARKAQRLYFDPAAQSTWCCKRRIILKIHSPYFLLSKILLTKIVAYAIQFLPQSRHNFSRLYGFSTLVDNFFTNNMHRQMRRGGVVHGGQR